MAISVRRYEPIGVLKRPPETADYTAPSRLRTAAFAVAALGFGAALVAMVANAVAIGSAEPDRASTLAWSFGLNTVAFGLLKLAIAVTLLGILARLWLRVDSVKAALPFLKAPTTNGGEPSYGDVDTPFGEARATRHAPGALPPHLLAQLMWAPMLLMGPLLVAAGFGLSIAQANASDPGTAQTLAAWVQGTQFLGEGFLLAGISFLLGSILASLRAGGGEVQQTLGVPVQTLKFPRSAIGFLALMMLGLVVELVQFALYLVAAYVPDDPSAWFAFLGPLREVGVGLLLAGIVLALYTIGTVLGFQFHRIRQLIETGR